MNPPPARPTTPKKELQLQGPRPSPLHIDSIKIKKPPPHPLRRHVTTSHISNPSQYFQQQQHFQSQQQQQQLVVIYTVSPKVINTTVNEFMSLVQRLTGPSSSPPGDLSPAARLASIEKTSPSSSHNHFNPPPPSHADVSNDDFINSILEGIDIMSQFPGILTPSPATMTSVPSGLFSPGGAGEGDPHGLLWQGGGGVTASPSSLFSAPLVSPSPSSWDLFQNFYDS